MHAVADIVRALRLTGPMPRQAIMTATGLRRAQLDQRLERLRTAGLVEETHSPVSTGGRPPRAISLRSHNGYVLCLMLSPTDVTAGAVDLTGTVIESQSRGIDATDEPTTMLQQCQELCEEVTTQVGHKPWATGISTPGPVDSGGRLVASPPLTPDWDCYPLYDRLSPGLSPIAWIGDNTHATALGEHRYGAGRGHHHMVYADLGSRIDAGIIANGTLQPGSGGYAGGIGHLPVPGETMLCRCGNTGCLEAVAGSAALDRAANHLADVGESDILRDLKASAPLDAAALAHAAASSDPHALRTLREAGSHIGAILALVVSLLNPSRLVIGGPLSQPGDVLLSAIRKSVHAHAVPATSRNLTIQRAGLGRTGAVLGTAERILDTLFSPEVFERWITAGSPQGLPDLVVPGGMDRAVGVNAGSSQVQQSAR